MSSRVRLVAALGVVCAFTVSARAQIDSPLNPQENDVFVRVIDCGAGLACVVKIPGKAGDHHYLVYDTGHWNTDDDVLMAVQRIVPDNEEIDVMVLSHSDSDHLGAADEILDTYTVHRVLRTGMK